MKLLHLNVVILNRYTYKLVKVPHAKNDSDHFIAKVKAGNSDSGWIEEMLEHCVETGSVGEGVQCMIGYLLEWYQDVARAELK